MELCEICKKRKTNNEYYYYSADKIGSKISMDYINNNNTLRTTETTSYTNFERHSTFICTPCVLKTTWAVVVLFYIVGIIILGIILFYRFYYYDNIDWTHPEVIKDVIVAVSIDFCFILIGLLLFFFLNKKWEREDKRFRDEGSNKAVEYDSKASSGKYLFTEHAMDN